ncbi:MAG TPA: hypothetical protein VFP78_01375 [Solirubrobacteraceae bacterium]|nr:hypothetical protein [Solirubrobacteraceae bacterium]
MGSTRVLVVANRTAATPRLLEAVRERAAEGPCEFTLLIPDAEERSMGDWTLDHALPLLEQAAGAPVRGLVDGPYAFDAIYQAVRSEGVEEVILSTMKRSYSRWVAADLPGRVARLGVRVTTIEPSVPVATSS